MSLFWFVLLGLMVWLTVTAVRPPTAPTPSPDPRSILQNRYARGEIDRDDYQDRLAALEGR
jgi:uncharacterized membrane protein